MPGYYGALLLLLFSVTVCGQQGRKDEGDKKEASVFQTEVPAHVYDIILSRPEPRSVTVSLLAGEDLEGYYSYGTDSAATGKKTAPISWKAGITSFTEIKDLLPGTRYYYRCWYRKKGESAFAMSPAYVFHTVRKPGESFVFDIQADSHLDENTSLDHYRETLRLVGKDSADFLVDLGDTWMTDKYRERYRESQQQYIAQRYYFGQLAHSVPLFLTLGNHDGEAGRGNRKGQDAGMLAWATSTRKQYYANPIPDGFYSGNNERLDDGGFPENYYAWEWGDVLCLVLDPFRYTTEARDPWQRTLGEKQYQWLRETLRTSKAKYRFVFIHNLVGGVDHKGQARGGAEAAAFYEWGGKNADSTDGFSRHRPGWEAPIHDLLVKYGVSVVFHGHDHFYARQEKDGIIYQLLPQPGARQSGRANQAAEYGYASGTILNAPGYLRVRRHAKGITIEFVTSASGRSGQVLHSYTLP